MMIKKIHWLFIFSWVIFGVISAKNVAYEFLNNSVLIEEFNKNHKWDYHHTDKNPFHNSNLPLKKEENKNEERIDENFENEYSKNLFLSFDLKNQYLHPQIFEKLNSLDEFRLHLFSIIRFNNPYFLHRFLSYCILRD